MLTSPGWWVNTKYCFHTPGLNRALGHTVTLG